jgi:hypothetical protein
MQEIAMHVFNNRKIGRGAICKYWRILAADAFGVLQHHSAHQKTTSNSQSISCDFVVLLGDDVKMLSKGWCDAVEMAFERIRENLTAQEHGDDTKQALNLMPVFGCVALHDITLQGMLSRPILRN